jgi:ABC-type amino acid transport substrate-binding protein
MKNILIALGFFIVLLFSNIIQAQVIPPEITEIKKSGQLVVSMTSFDNIPFYAKFENDVIGLDADIARKVAQILNVKLIFRRDAPTFQDVVEQVRRGEANIAISKLSITPPRLSTVRFSEPYVKLHQGLLINRLWLSGAENGRALPKVIRNFDGGIAFIQNTAYDTFARSNFPKATFMPKENWDQVLEAVIKGNAALAYRDEFEIKRISIERPESNITTKAITLTDSTDYIAAVVDFRNTQLLEIVNFVIKNDFNDINVHKLIVMYQAMQKKLSK